MSDFTIFAILGLVQGLTEFLPVSSTGHLILAREFLGAQSANGLAVDAVLQFGTILAVVVYFFRDLLSLAKTGISLLIGASVSTESVRLLSAIAIGTIPAIFIGLLLENTMETVFRNPSLVAYTLIAGSFVFVAAEYALSYLRKNLDISHVDWRKGLLIGLFQCVALIPGMSRSGMTISGGLFLGLSREAAARFGFLLSVPIIAGSGIKKLIDLGSSGSLSTIEMPLFIGTFVAFVTGLLAIHALLLFVRAHSLNVFAVYRIVLAIIILSLPVF